MSTTEKTVATPSGVVSEMQACVAVMRALAGGTKTMRAAGERYLPKEPAETKDAYDARLARSTLYNAFGKTVEDMTGKVFYKPIALGDDVPEKLKSYAENIDNAGRHLDVFARDVFRDGMQTGIGYIVVDLPLMPERPDGNTPTIADEQAAGIRPYLVYVPIERALGWLTETMAGAETLTQFRYLECVTESDGPWHEKEIQQVRVLTPGRWEVYRQELGGTWVLHSEGVSRLPKITVVPVYLNRSGFMTGKPPLEKLAELNVAHWQSASDQRNILHVARVPILYAAGFAEDSELVVGASNMFRSSNADAKLAYVEHSGKAIEAGRNDLQDLISQMESMGLQLLVAKNQTATGEVRDDVKENSPLAAMATALQDALEAAFGFMAEYENLGEDKGGSLPVNKDFGVQVGALDVQQIIDAYRSNLIDAQTAIEELIRRGFLSDATDPEVVLDRLTKEMAQRQMDLERAANIGNDNVGAAA